MNMRVEFNGLRFNLPHGWADITDDLPAGSPPSLARPTGVGAVQFSVAKYRGGKEPDVTVESLQKLLADFHAQHAIPGAEPISKIGKTMSVGATSIANGELISATYLSNGKDVVLTTYICQDTDSPELHEDLDGVEEILTSMDF
jgi:hypothetical protein